MIYWAIKAAQDSKYVHDVFVSTEDIEIETISCKYEATVIKRPQQLSDDSVEKMDAICHAAKYITEEYKKPTIIVSLQANSPQVNASHIDQGIGHLIKYKRVEVMSVDAELNQDAAIRVMTYDTVFRKTLSVNFGVFVADILDVHDERDVIYLENNYTRS